MKICSTLMSISAAILLVTGCQNLNPQSLLQSGMQAMRALTLSATQVKQLSNQACQQADSSHKLAAANSRYQKRLNKIAVALNNDIDGIPFNYGVYLTEEQNAWAIANGCIRVYSGLMDIMTDNELEGIIGHEMGHVMLGHNRKAMQLALGTSAARSAIASTSSVVGALSQSQLGELTTKLINAQFSQEQESQADDYAYQLMKNRRLNPQGLVTGFEKLAKLTTDKQGSWFSTHPALTERAQHIRQLIANDQQ